MKKFLTKIYIMVPYCVALVAVLSACSKNDDEDVVAVSDGKSEQANVSGSSESSSSVIRTKHRYMNPLRVDHGDQGEYTGSSTCLECHEKFYELWSTSHHGKAMQPFTPELAKTIPATETPVAVRDCLYSYDFDESGGWVIERFPDGTEKKHVVDHTLGGKNMYNFITTLERGRLQILPIAYEPPTGRWFDNTTDMLVKRHFSEDDVRDLSLHWTDRQWSFNTACFDCHVSQLEKNYDLATDSYKTDWGEPGISCEQCHGPAEEHIRVCREAAAEGREIKSEDLKLIRWHEDLTAKTRDDSCAPCHAKHSPISDGFQSGEFFFDHYDLIGYENDDFFADGRDDGENYTYTLWMDNPCAGESLEGALECIHCHTSSGRYRHKDDPNQSCLPCHNDKVENVEEHTHHSADSAGSECISCHMPMTKFTAMNRSDHSFRPPTPQATIEFNSPNACNICHEDKTPEWASKKVNEWHGEDSQNEALTRGRFIKAARANDWSKLPEMLAYMNTEECSRVTTVSLLRLLANCQDSAKWETVKGFLRNEDPWIRSAAAFSMTYEPSPETTDLLLDLLDDEFKVVRHRAMEALIARGYARMPAYQLDPRWAKSLEEYEHSLDLWQDRWSTHFNKGVFYDNVGKPQLALASYEKSIDLRDDVASPLVNASMNYARQGNLPKAAEYIERALKAEPNNSMVNINAGMLAAEQQDVKKAEFHFRKALEFDPMAAQAAFNLGILLSNRGDIVEGLEMAKKASELVPQDPRYANTYAFYLNQAQKFDEAISVLESAIKAVPAYPNHYFLLGSIYESQNKFSDAIRIYAAASDSLSLAPQVRQQAMQLKARVQQKLGSLLQ